MNNFLISRLEENAVAEGNEIAVKDYEKSITYRELWDRINRYADIILSYTEGRQLPIIVYQDRTVDFIVSMLACIKAGCFYIPVVKETPPGRIDRIISDSGCCLALVDEPVDDERLIQVNVKQGKAVNTGVRIFQLSLWRRLKNIAYVMYTSGTTGSPKGVIIGLDNLQNLIESFGDILYENIKEHVNVAVLASFGFDSSVKQIYCSLYYGHTLVIANEKDKKFSKTMQRFYSDNNIAVSDGTPSNMRILVMTRHSIVNNVRWFVIGGENFRSDIARTVFDAHANPVEIINVYGPTECCVDVAYYKVNRDVEDGEYLPIGQPLLNTGLKILTEEGKEITNIEEKGELVISGKQVGYGYTSEINESFLFGPDMYDNSYRTGDVAKYNRAGQIVILGRKDNQIKKNGYRIELDEIAAHLNKLDSVMDSVVRKQEVDGALKIVAYVVLRQETEQELIWAEMRNALTEYMIPDYMVVIEDIPLNVNCKVDEHRLNECFHRIYGKN